MEEVARRINLRTDGAEGMLSVAAATAAIAAADLLCTI